MLLMINSEDVLHDVNHSHIGYAIQYQHNHLFSLMNNYQLNDDMLVAMESVVYQIKVPMMMMMSYSKIDRN
jgi:hypothetical protein